MREFKLAPEGRGKVKRYYHELESGLLDPTGLDRRLAGLLAITPRFTREAIFTWRPRPITAAPALRGQKGQFAAAISAASPPKQAEDEVDALFRSDR